MVRIKENEGKSARGLVSAYTWAMRCPQLGVKALTYNDLIQAQKEISAHNQQLREQTEQLEKGNRSWRSQSLRLVSILPGWDPSLPLSTIRML